MYGCFDGLIVYGWAVGHRNGAPIEAEELPGDIEMFALDVVRNYMGEAVYGYPVHLDPIEGKIIISDEAKARVKLALLHYKERVSTEEAEQAKLGFYTVVTGDFEVVTI
jgi:hypothetical protein